ncbi:PadR family transcriptional regulator [Tumebacillus sp. ITR2]|uniref:PadR family transcriptional regulator n=1 Tax=Tumebacillus amylolyticus TaxID=2801339 RepID=A0ABS1J6W9_9BACL|nr:PadR family transcriptional regulator [Tumebacillus amylolyticus]MBL0386018.1 PadR family transcriptional regulator [Tumebacillus amylolyticus]
MALRYAVLGLLSKEPLTGYDLAQKFQTNISHFWNAHHTQIYRELQKLEKEALVSYHLVEQHDRPDKKVYSLTDDGLRELLGWMAEAPKPPSMKNENLLRVSLFHLIPSQQAIQYLEASRESHVQILEAMKKWGTQHLGSPELPPSRDLIGETLTLDFGMRFIQTWIDWCDQAIRMFRSLPE